MTLFECNKFVESLSKVISTHTLYDNVQHIMKCYDESIVLDEDIKWLMTSPAMETIKAKGKDITGTQVKTSQELFDLFSMFRDSRWETSRTVFLKDGVVVGTYNVSSKSPLTTSYIRKYSDDMSSDWKRFLNSVGKRMFDKGANQIITVHNHPAGFATESEGDVRATKYLYKEFKKNEYTKNMNYGGEFILGDYDYTWLQLDANGTLFKHHFNLESNDDKYIDRKFVPNKNDAIKHYDTSLNNIMLSNADEFGKKIVSDYKEEFKHSSMVVYCDTKLRVIGVQEIDNYEFNNEQVWSHIKNVARDIGAGNIIVVTEDKEIYEKSSDKTFGGFVTIAFFYDSENNKFIKVPQDSDMVVTQQRFNRS